MTLAVLTEEQFATVLIDIAVIVAVARVVGVLFKRIGQPAVVGEIIAGILLGPTLLGAFPGQLDLRLFPLDVRDYLQVIAQLGLVIFMFIVGLELDASLIRGKERIAAVISVSSVALPFALGIAVATVLYGGHQVVKGEDVDFLPFALFIGASMSVTAFPVLARILSERRMYRTDVGALTLACAAVDDILAWSLLALVVAIIQASGIGDLPEILGESIAFLVVMFVVVKPLLARLTSWYDRAGRLTPNILAVVLVGVLASAWLTSEIGIHAIFGAFVFGVVMPREHTERMFHEILERLEQVSVILLLPVFFIATGLNVNVRAITVTGLWELVLILLAACAGKFLGATISARAQGIAPRKASAIGILMNTRGLTELVILNIGLQVGVLDRELFTLLVVMAIVTTVMTEPLLRLVYPDRILRRDIEDAERAGLGSDVGYRVLVRVADPDDDVDLVDVATQLASATELGEVVLSRFLATQPKLEIGSGLGAELADMTAAMRELHGLAARSEEHSVRTAVRAQFSADPAQDLVAQVTAADPDVVLVRSPTASVAADMQTVGALVLDADHDVAVVEGGPGRAETFTDDSRVALMLDRGPHDGAAAEIAARLARARGGAIDIVDRHGGRAGREATALARALATAGIPSEIHGPDWPGPSGDGEPPLGTGLVVVAANAEWIERAARGDGSGTTRSHNGVPVLVVKGREELAPATPGARVTAIFAAPRGREAESVSTKGDEQ